MLDAHSKSKIYRANLVPEYAASFFLLADRLRDAANVIANQIGDLQLAIAITRVYEGDNGPILRGILEERVLPDAALAGNRWMASWAFWMLGRRDMAVRALIVSFPSSFIKLHLLMNIVTDRNSSCTNADLSRQSGTSYSPVQVLSF